LALGYLPVILVGGVVRESAGLGLFEDNTLNGGYLLWLTSLVHRTAAGWIGIEPSNKGKGKTAAP
jgi:hypothetical protein